MPTKIPPASPRIVSAENSNVSVENHGISTENQQTSKENVSVSTENTELTIKNKNKKGVKQGNGFAAQQSLPIQVQVRKLAFQGIQAPLLIMEALSIIEQDPTLESGLTAKQEMFCVLMTRDAQCFGNRTLSYSVAYDIPLESIVGADNKLIVSSEQASANYAYCSMGGSRMMRNDKVLARYNELLEQNWDEKLVRREHSWLLTQRDNLMVKLNALHLYYKVENKISEKSHVTHSLDDILKDINGTGRPEPNPEPIELTGVAAE